jgi:hypothetical protein
MRRKSKFPLPTRPRVKSPLYYINAAPEQGIGMICPQMDEHAKAFTPCNIYCFDADQL